MASAPTLPPLAAPQLLVILVGIPGSGKSTFAHHVMTDAAAALGQRRWQRISQDMLGSRKRCVAAAQQALGAGDHLLIDRCNFDASQRAHWLRLRGASNTHRIAVFHDVTQSIALHRVLSRRLPEGGVDAENMTKSKIRGIVARMSNDLRPPLLTEGFHEVHICRGDDLEAAAFARRRLGALILQNGGSQGNPW